MGFWQHSHFKAMLYRRYVIAKRSWIELLVSIGVSLIFSGAAILMEYLMSTLIQEVNDPTTFKSFMTNSNNLYFIYDNNTEDWADEWVKMLEELYYNDTGISPNITYFDSRKKMNDQMYEESITKEGNKFVKMGIEFMKKDNFGYHITTFYNSTKQKKQFIENLMAIEIQETRIMWKLKHGVENDFLITSTKMIKKLEEIAFGLIAPMLISVGLTSIVTAIIVPPVADLAGEFRDYAVSMGMKLVPYWVANFVIDFILWIITAVITWIFFYCFKLKSFMDNLANTFYMFIFMGPSFNLYTYAQSFLFSNAENAARNSFMINVIIIMISMILSLLWDNFQAPEYMEWIFALFPFISFQRATSNMMTLIGFNKQPLSYFWKQSLVRPHLIMQFGDIPIYIIILAIIEKVRLTLKRVSTEHKIANYHELFEELRQRHVRTEEVERMEQEVRERNDYAVKVTNVSRLFFNTSNEPIPAVNGVTLGVPRGSIFGFLGANGAGKTTLIRMITSIIPPSEGTIEVNGKDISIERDTTQIAICPQFNSHLCYEMTPVEHFKMYGLIFGMSNEEIKEHQDLLFRLLEIEDYKNKLVSEMSGGQQRRVSVALAFYGPAQIILLDEPTSSLDPYSRHTVHELINRFKGMKTFMLCTHMLAEAEALCDIISIMVKGTIYTIGSPQYLTSKFGTEYKVEILIGPDARPSQIDEFFKERIPTASLTLQRPNARIYSIPADTITLEDLFWIMEEGKQNGVGYNYYTCASSSLERVFLEIVKMSEEEVL